MTLVIPSSIQAIIMKLGQFASLVVLVCLSGCGGNTHSKPVAEWVISVKGSLITQGKTVPIRSVENLPQGRFRLQTIDVSGCAIKDAELEQLDTTRSLEVLNLQETPVTNKGLAYLSGLHNLKELTLYGTRIGDSGLESLKDLSQLNKLELSYTNVTDAGLEHLKGLTSLTSLHLYGTPTTEEGVEGLRKALPKCQIYR